jgi:hypothetical protein
MSPQKIIRCTKLSYDANVHANPPAPRTRGADPKAHAFGRSVLSVLLAPLYRNLST